MEIILALLPMAYIFLSEFVLQEGVLMLTTSPTETYFKHGYRYHKIRKAFSKFHRHPELIVNYNIELKLS